jgi:TRAP-type C4-dicarboxylate transport system permease small subunit
MNTHTQLKYIVRVYDWGALTSFCAMMACILIEVFSRNVIHVPTTWAEEASRLFCVWSVFLGSASAWYRGAHIIIHVLVSRLTGNAKLFLQIVVDILTAVFLLSVWFGTIFIMKINYPTKTTALEISISYFYLGLFLGLTGMIIFHFNNMVQIFRKMIGPSQGGN